MNPSSIADWQLSILENNLKAFEAVLRMASPGTLTTYRDGDTGWTALEVLCHVRDMEGIMLERARLTVEQADPALPSPDPDTLAAERNYNAQDFETALAEWKTHRLAYIGYMQSRSAGDWERVGLHPRRGPLSLLDQLMFVPLHDSIHIEQITRLLREGRTGAGTSGEPPISRLVVTVESLVADLTACGLRTGQTVVVHTAMSKLGYVVGGAEAVIQALLRVLGPTGTLMMPTHTSENTEPSNWQHPPIHEREWSVIRAQTPPFNPATTPTREMGRVAELFRTWPGALRSSHPVGSFAALGPNAETLVGSHPLEDEFGPESPIGRLYALGGYVLLLGVGHSNNTSLHMAETLAHWSSKRKQARGSAMLVEGVRQWVTYESLDLDTDDFEQIGAAFEAAFSIQACRVGEAEARLLPQAPLVDFAVEWMEKNRG